MTSVCVDVLQTYVAISLAGGTFEHELLNLGVAVMIIGLGLAYLVHEMLS